MTPPRYAPVTPQQAAAHEGSHARYVAGCRCRPCLDASAADYRYRYRAKAYGRWQPFADAGPVREHVTALRASGLGRARIAELAGIPDSTLSDLLYGRRRQRPARQVRRETAERILSVRPAVALLAPSARTDATGGIRRLRALVAAGYGQGVLARRLGTDPSNFARLMRAPQMTAARLRRVVALYDDLWDVPPDESAPWDASVAARARRFAAARGWVPPLAWDDSAIDDPAAFPAEGWQRQQTALRDSAALAEDAAELIGGQGYDRLTAAMRLGVSRHALDKAIARTAASAAETAGKEDSDAA